MPRTPPSAADQQLVANAVDHGYTVSPRQVERWREQGLLPSNVRRALGRGHGSTSEPPPEAFDLLVWLAEHARPGRRPRDLAFGAFEAGFAVPEATIRAAFVEAVDGVKLAIERIMPADAKPEEVAEAVLATGWRGSLIPARIRRIDRAIAESGINLAAPTLAALDPGFGSDQEPATGNDWTFAAVNLLLTGGSGIDMAMIGQLTRSLLPAGAAAPLAGQTEYRWPIEGDGADDQLGTEEGLRALVPQGDLRDLWRELATTTPLAELHEAWRVAVELLSWAEGLCDGVEHEVAAQVCGPATEEWINSTFGLGRLMLTIALREPAPSPATVAVRTLTLTFIRNMIRQMRQLWPVEGNFRLLDNPIVGPKFLTNFVRS